jgi:hypothetical protein
MSLTGYHCNALHGLQERPSDPENGHSWRPGPFVLAFLLPVSRCTSAVLVGVNLLPRAPSSLVMHMHRGAPVCIETSLSPDACCPTSNLVPTTGTYTEARRNQSQEEPTSRRKVNSRTTPEPTTIINRDTSLISAWAWLQPSFRPRLAHCRKTLLLKTMPLYSGRG